MKGNGIPISLKMKCFTGSSPVSGTKECVPKPGQRGLTVN